MSDKTRTEKDPLGSLEVPDDGLYGVQTLRAVQNFPISGLGPMPAFVDATVRIKRAAALTHKETGRLDPKIADAIIKAADEILAGKHREHFVVDVYQAGAGTSHNMNVNEVLANRANEILGAKRGTYSPVHPNDHVNMAQSTNDVIPTAIRLACLCELGGLEKAFDGLAKAFEKKGKEFDGVLKSGRTHLQDAMPIRLGQELDAESGRDALRIASMSALSAARAHLGTLDKVTRVVRLGIYLATSGDFVDQPKVADAASELFESIFGKEKTSVRMVLGVASLPLGMPVELEVILEVAE